ncbi:YraN family protein [Patescibacteria group bacterium]
MVTERRKFGDLGEDVACRHLIEKKGWDILDRNYLKKWGEIDIVSREIGKTEDILHFIEVKTVSRENIALVSRERFVYDLPEEKVDDYKIKRLHRAIDSYLMENKYISRETGECNIAWQLDIIAVFIDMDNKQARIRMTENIVLEE